MDVSHESVGLTDDVDQGEAKRPSHTPGGRASGRSGRKSRLWFDSVNFQRKLLS
jgi:hypothetical protein